MFFVNGNEKMKSLSSLADAQYIGKTPISFLFSNSQSVTID